MLDLLKTADVVVIGGGVIGLTIARALALRDVRNVVVLERSQFGAESSWAAAGMLAPQAEADCDDELFRLCCQSRDLYPSFTEALHYESGLDVELDQTGTLYLAFTEEDECELAARFEWQSNAGLPIEQLTPADARILEPSIPYNVRMVLRFPLDIQVENRRVISALVAANELLGIHLCSGTTAQTIKTKGRRVTGVSTSRGFISTETVVLAGGAWTSQIETEQDDSLRKSLSNIRLRPVRGQMLCFEAVPQVCGHVIYSRRGYVVPRRDGRLLAGSTTEDVGFDRRVTAEGVHSILTAALEIVPKIADLRFVDVWSGLRPRADDGLPVLGRCAEIEGVVYATGHYRNGILLAPITGEMVSRMVLTRTGSPEFDAFSPERFRLVAHE